MSLAQFISGLWTVNRPHSTGLHWTYIPNFVDTTVFRPVCDSEERHEARAQFGVPSGAFVIGCVAALKFDHKRLDYLIQEVGNVARENGNYEMPFDGAQGRHGMSERGGVKKVGGQRSEVGEQGTKPPSDLRLPTSNLFLLLAGATTPETAQVESMAAEVLPGRYRILRDVPRIDMPDLYRCMDVFVLPSLFEMMPIAVLEALASGLPVVTNSQPVLEWMVGGRMKDAGGRMKGEGGDREHQVSGLGFQVSETGGICVDMATDGALGDALERLTPDIIRDLGAAARQRAESVFGKSVVIEQYVRYYEEVMAKKG